jgi:hypothetical protein
MTKSRGAKELVGTRRNDPSKHHGRERGQSLGEKRKEEESKAEETRTIQKSSC